MRNIVTIEDQIEMLPRDDTARIASDYEPSALEIEVCRQAICREFGDNGTDGYYVRILKAVHAAASAKPAKSDRTYLAGFNDARAMATYVIMIAEARIASDAHPSIRQALREASIAVSAMRPPSEN